MGTIQNGSYISQYTGDQIDTLLGKSVWQSNPNLLDNWYFVGGGSQQGGRQFPINQRGQTSYTGAVYGIDRWVGATGINVTVDNDGIILSNSSNAPHAFGQTIENPDRLLGNTVTLSVLFYYNGVQYFKTKTVELPTSWPASSKAWLEEIIISGTYIGNFQIYWNSSTGRLWFYLVVYDGKTIKYQAVKLEIGDTQTLAHYDETAQEWVLNDPPPNYQQELAKCQRYRLVFKNEPSRVIFLGFGKMGTATTARVKILTPVPIRTAPSFSGYSSGDCSLIVNKSAIPVTSFRTLWEPDATGFYLDATVETSQSIHDIAVLQLNVGKTLIFDANL